MQNYWKMAPRKKLNLLLFKGKISFQSLPTKDEQIFFQLSELEHRVVEAETRAEDAEDKVRPYWSLMS